MRGPNCPSATIAAAPALASLRWYHATGSPRIPRGSSRQKRSTSSACSRTPARRARHPELGARSRRRATASGRGSPRARAGAPPARASCMHNPRATAGTPRGPAPPGCPRSRCRSRSTTRPEVDDGVAPPQATDRGHRRAEPLHAPGAIEVRPRDAARELEVDARREVDLEGGDRPRRRSTSWRRRAAPRRSATP